jgi:hypothetical protein
MSRPKSNQPTANVLSCYSLSQLLSLVSWVAQTTSEMESEQVNGAASASDEGNPDSGNGGNDPHS